MMKIAQAMASIIFVITGNLLFAMNVEKHAISADTEIKSLRQICVDTLGCTRTVSFGIKTLQKLCIECLAKNMNTLHNLGRLPTPLTEQVEYQKKQDDLWIAELSKKSPPDANELRGLALQGANVRLPGEINLTIYAGAPLWQDMTYCYKKYVTHTQLYRRNWLFMALLTNLGADLNDASCNDDSLLHNAVRDNNTPVVYFLIAAGANLQSTDGYRETPLHTAIHYGNENIIRALLKAGASMVSKNQFGKTEKEIAQERDINLGALAQPLHGLKTFERTHAHTV